MSIDFLKLREALENSWDTRTSHLAASRKNNPAFGQCYPTSRVVQYFFPEMEIIEGQVWTGKSLEKHFWNGLKIDAKIYHIDLTWRQFPAGSEVREFKFRDREKLNDSAATIQRVEILLNRVKKYLAKNP